jgi:subtilisin family serine protease
VNGAEPPRVVGEFPWSLGGAAEVLHRRRIGVGVDRRGQVVLARPDSIQVDFGGDERQRDRVATLVNKTDCSAPDATEWDEAEATGVLTVRLDPEERNGRWQLGRLDAELSRFHDEGVRAELNHVVFGASSAIPALLGGAVAGAAAPLTSPTAVMTPENKAVLITTAEPTIRPRSLRQPLRLDGHRRPRVLVLDTGLRTESVDGESRPEHAFLRGPDRGWQHVHLHDGWQSNPAIEAIDDEDEPDDDHSGLLDFEAGHGTFIAGIVRQICPDAEIHPAGVLSSFGEGSVARVRSTIRRLTNACGPFDIVVMSFGNYCANDDPGLFGARLPGLLGDAVGVAAAGNLRSGRPYFPAALSGVIGVGALDRAGRAWFTNFGSWVDACAPAVDVVSTFFEDVTERFPGRPDRYFGGWARWSGTSFAAPKVAGAIAQEMYLSQVSAGAAWQRLSSTASLRVPDLGVVVNV